MPEALPSVFAYALPSAAGSLSHKGTCHKVPVPVAGGPAVFAQSGRDVAEHRTTQAAFRARLKVAFGYLEQARSLSTHCLPCSFIKLRSLITA